MYRLIQVQTNNSSQATNNLNHVWAIIIHTVYKPDIMLQLLLYFNYSKMSTIIIFLSLDIYDKKYFKLYELVPQFHDKYNSFTVYYCFAS